MNRLAVLILVALSVVACGAPKYPDSWSGKLDVSALPEQEAFIVSTALAAWRERSGGLVTAEITTEHGAGLPVVMSGEECGEGHGACYTYTDIKLRPCDTSTPAGYDRCYQAIAHEIGHWLDAKHVDDENAIMFHADRGNTRISSADLDSLFAAVEP